MTMLYIHSIVARTFSAHSMCTVTFAHAHACHEKGVCCMCVISLYLAISLLMFHPSLLFLYIHTSTSPFSPQSCRTFPSARAQDMRHSAPASRSLATWPSQMQTLVMSPRSSTRSLRWTVTRCSLTSRTSMKSLASRKTHTRTLDCSVFSSEQ